MYLQPVKPFRLAGNANSLTPLGNHPFDRIQCVPGRVVLFAQVRKHQMLQAVHIGLAQQRRRLIIAQMPQHTTHAPFQR